MAKLSVLDIKAILQAEKSDALSAMNASKLSEERSRAMDYYMGDMTSDMPAQVDRSKAVSTDVADTVEGLMPSLMEIFTSSDEVVQFAPQGIEDEDAAEQETDYINYVFNEKNPGFLILYSFCKDALLSKNGIVKAWWEEKETEETQHYKGLTDDALALLSQDPEIEIVEQTDYPLGGYPDGEQGAPSY